MKKWISVFLVFAMVLSVFVFVPAASAAQEDSFAGTFSDADDALKFNPARDSGNTQYLGRFTVAGNTTVPGALVFDSYKVTYVKNPITGITYGTGANAYDISDLFTRTIKVPVSYNGAAFSASSVADAPILMYTAYGGETNVRQTAAAATTVSNGSFNVMRIAMSQGWVLVEPNNRGAGGAAIGTAGTPSYYNPGKLPAPYVDVKSAIRYLRHNGDLIPGDTEKIFFTGSSSGGGMAAMVGATGNTHAWDDYFTEIGAVMDERDDVFAVVPCCAYINRDWVTPISVWYPWGDPAELPTGTDPLNIEFARAYLEYQQNLNLSVVRGGTTIPLNSHKNYVDYITPYIKDSIIKFLNHIFANGTNNAPGAPGTFVNGMNTLPVAIGKAAVDAYLGSSRNADGDNIPARSRAWIKPVYDDPSNPTRVVDLENTDLFGDYFKYVIPNAVAANSNGGFYCFDLTKPYGGTADLYVWGQDVPNNKFGYGDGSGTIRGAQINSNGVSNISGLNNTLPSSCAGKRTDYLVVISKCCWDVIGKESGGTLTYAGVTQEYKDLITLQNNSVDPMHWILGKGNAVDVAPNWFLRLGSHDNRAKDPFIFNIASALEMQGKNVDAGIAWDQGHAYTQDVVEMFAFAKEALIKAAENAINALPGAADIVPSNPTGSQVAYNDTALLKAVGRPASGAGANAVAATGVYALIATAKTNGGAVDGDFDAVLIAKLNAISTKINQLSNTVDKTLEVFFPSPFTRSSTLCPAGQFDPNDCREYWVIVIDSGGTATLTKKPVRINVPVIATNSAYMMRCEADINAGGVIIATRIMPHTKLVTSARVESDRLILGYFGKANDFTYTGSENVYLFKNDADGVTTSFRTLTISSYIAELKGKGGFDWNDRVYIYATGANAVTSLVVYEDSRADPGDPNTSTGSLFEQHLKLERFSSTPLTAPASQYRSIFYDVYDPVAKGGADPNKKYPLYIWMHGMNRGVGDDTHIYGRELETTPGATDYFDAANVTFPSQQAQFNNGAAYVVLPKSNEHLAGGGAWGANYVPALTQMIRDFMEDFGDNVDLYRIYIGGASAGGDMTWRMLQASITDGSFPVRFAAGVPVCPSGNPTQAQMESIAHIPLWVIYGKLDSLWGSTGRAAVERLKGILETYPGASEQSRTSALNQLFNQEGVEIYQHSAWEPVSYDLIFGHDPGGGAIPYYGMINASDPLNPYYADPNYSWHFDGKTWSSFSNNDTFLSWLGRQAIILPTTSIKIATENGPSPSMMSVARNSRIEFGVSVNDGASGAGIVWTVSDPSLAMVDANGTVTVMNKVG
ncbi:MAG: hypothetical protein LBH28_00220, partial [Oscillospiraceae bacterium]|nr:hypothetical protein [Oscillospiraceae bacterium]